MTLGELPILTYILDFNLVLVIFFVIGEAFQLRR